LLFIMMSALCSTRMSWLPYPLVSINIWVDCISMFPYVFISVRTDEAIDLLTDAEEMNSMCYYLNWILSVMWKWCYWLENQSVRVFGLQCVNLRLKLLCFLCTKFAFSRILWTWCNRLWMNCLLILLRYKMTTTVAMSTTRLCSDQNLLVLKTNLCCRKGRLVLSKAFQ
jgi:hypothetical protein